MMRHAVNVLQPDAEFDYVHAQRVREELQVALGTGATAVVFDLERVSFMDSAGLRVVLEAMRELGPEHVALARANDQVSHLLATVGVDERIHLFATVEAAVAALSDATD